MTTTPPCMTTWTVRVWSPPTLPSPSQAALSIFSPWVWPSYPMVRSISSIFQTGKIEVNVAQSCLTLCDHMDYTVHGILQARILAWVAFPFSRPRDGTQVSWIQADSLPAEPQGKPFCYIDWLHPHFVPEVRKYISSEGQPYKVLLIFDNAPSQSHQSSSPKHTVSNSGSRSGSHKDL